MNNNKSNKIVYLDNAATTFPKPPEVISEITGTLRNACGNPGRSSHIIASRASDIVFECRNKVGNLFGCNPEQVIFTMNATYALNLAIKTVLKKGDHVLISDIEHNSVFRPVHALFQKGFITYSIYKAISDPQKQIDEIKNHIRPETAAIISCHHSNIFTFTTPIREIGDFCHKNNLIFIVDASQSAGSYDINLQNDHIDVLCAPGHKGLYGAPGVGFAIFGQKFLSENNLPSTFIEGGSGILSKSPLMPDFLPERLESGTLPLISVAGLSKGIDFINSFHKGEILRYETNLCKTLKTELNSFPKVKIYGENVGQILLFSVLGVNSEDFAERLSEKNICVRAGFHCAPLAHKHLDTSESGAVRISFGAFNTMHDVDYFLSKCFEILKKV